MSKLDLNEILDNNNILDLKSRDCTWNLETANMILKDKPHPLTIDYIKDLVKMVRGQLPTISNTDIERTLLMILRDLFLFMTNTLADNNLELDSELETLLQYMSCYINDDLV